MAGHTSFTKRQKEQKRREKQRDKLDKKTQRKLDKQTQGPEADDDMFGTNELFIEDMAISSDPLS
jgi:hypothetical protein